MPKHFAAIFLVISALLTAPARAQDAAAPFDGDLQRLAEILGTLHYLRGICGNNEGLKWRNEMQALIDGLNRVFEALGDLPSLEARCEELIAEG